MGYLTLRLELDRVVLNVGLDFLLLPLSTELSCNSAPMNMYVKLYRCDIIKARAPLGLSSCRIPSDQSQWTKTERSHSRRGRRERERKGGRDTEGKGGDNVKVSSEIWPPTSASSQRNQCWEERETTFWWKRMTSETKQKMREMCDCEISCEREKVSHLTAVGS